MTQPMPSLSASRTATKNFSDDSALKSERQSSVTVSFASFVQARVEPLPNGYRSIGELAKKWASKGNRGAELAQRRVAAANEDPRSGPTGLKKLRLARGMSQADLALAIGTQQPNIARLESGRNPNIQVDTIRALQKALLVSCDELIAALTEDQNNVR